jgi:hypothetical protein
MRCPPRFQPGQRCLSVHQYAAPTRGGGRLGDIITMRECLPYSSGFAISPRLESTPVFHGHGKWGPLVRPDAAQKSCDVVTSWMGRPDYRLVMYPNLGHLVLPGKALDMLAFLSEVIPLNDTCRARLNIQPICWSRN